MEDNVTVGRSFPVKTVRIIDSQLLISWAFWAYMFAAMIFLILTILVVPDSSETFVNMILGSILAGTLGSLLAHIVNYLRVRRVSAIRIEDDLLQVPLLWHQTIPLARIRSIESDTKYLVIGVRGGFTQKLPWNRLEIATDRADLLAEIRLHLDQSVKARVSTSARLVERQRSLPVVSIALSLILMLFWFVFPHKPSLELAALDRPLIAQGELHRLVTYALIHLNAKHLFTNVASILILGYSIEGIVSQSRYVTTFVAGVIGAGVVSYFLGLSGTFTAGASGGAFALIGMFVWILLDPKFPLPAKILRIPEQLAAAILIVMLLPIFPGVDIAAHIGGFLTGLAMSAWYFMNRDIANIDAKH